ncbi:MAG TPA: sulfotransferase family 2 domain-containing protein [Rhizomicrobium sp.]
MTDTSNSPSSSAARRDVVFMHIPKTAGTSLRSALELTLQQDHLLLRDYGGEPETTPELYRLIYEEGRILEFREQFNDKQRGIFLAGHFPDTKKMGDGGAARYWDHFNAESFVTFLRHPVDRVYSEFAHFVNHRGWTAGFEEFVTTKRGRQRCRRMSMLLSGVDFDTFGFVGFMEEFDESLAALRRYLGVDLPARRVNVGNYGTIDPEVLESERYRTMLLDLSQEDIALYERLRGQRSGRYVAPGADSSVAAHYIGRVAVADHRATGWLCNKAREFIAAVDIVCEGRTIASIPADRYRMRPRDRGFSRSGICGFEIDLRTLAGLHAGSKLTFRAHGSNYELVGSPVPL